MNRHGGDVTLVHLPEIGIRGNAHFMFSDLNNIEIADQVSQFLHKKGVGLTRLRLLIAPLNLLRSANIGESSVKTIAASFLTASAILLGGEMSSHAQAQSPTQTGTGSSASGAAAAQLTPAQQLMGDFAPKLAELTDNVLFGDVWERPGLSKRDRSLITVSALIAMNCPDQLRSHLARARDNGVTQEEVVEVITHLAFYAGWPNAVTAVSVAREVFQKK